MAKKVLVVDDEKMIVKGLRFSLEQDGMDVDCAYDGEEALTAIKQNTYDVVLLDVMLPKLSGFDVCQQVREFSDVPIIMLTAKGEDMDKILGLEYGADDYITKPFGTSELLARIRTSLRHSNRLQTDSTLYIRPYVHGKMLLDFSKRLLTIDGNEIHLTPIEYKIVAYLAQNSGKVVTYSAILSNVWGPYADDDNRILRVNMANIRRKLEKDPAQPCYIFTEVGVGYRMAEADELS